MDTDRGDGGFGLLALYATTPDWNGTVHLCSNGGFVRPGGEFGVFDWLEKKWLELHWSNGEVMRLRWDDKVSGYREEGDRPVLMKVVGVPHNHRGWLTCAGKRDGLGAQFQALMSTILFADWMNLEYVHTPLRCVDHAPGGRSDWTTDCEAFINIRDSFPSVEALEGYCLEASSDFRRATARERRVIYATPHCHGFANAFPDAYCSIRKLLRSCYHSSLNLPSLVRSSCGEATVAIHVRRGDVQSDNAVAFRYTSDQRIINSVRNLKSLIDGCGKKASFHLYSQGKHEDFVVFANEGLELHLNEDVMSTFHQLVMADYLIMAKSSFSYSAAILSRGVVLYEPFWHPPLSEWVRVYNGEIDGKEFAGALRNLVGY